MKRFPELLWASLAVCLCIAGCQKESVSPEPASAAKPAASAPAAATPAPPTAAADAAVNGAETTAKLAGVAWALKQDEIKNDPKGQWAIEAKASSTYNDGKGTDAWSANRATGKPDVDKYGDDGHAWTSKTPDAGIEWL